MQQVGDKLHGDLGAQPTIKIKYKTLSDTIQIIHLSICVRMSCLFWNDQSFLLPKTNKQDNYYVKPSFNF